MITTVSVAWICWSKDEFKLHLMAWYKDVQHCWDIFYRHNDAWTTLHGASDWPNIDMGIDHHTRGYGIVCIFEVVLWNPRRVCIVCCINFWGSLYFWNRSYILVIFIYQVTLIFWVVFLLRVIFILELSLFWGSSSSLKSEGGGSSSFLGSSLFLAA